MTKHVTIDGNTAAASMAYKLNEVVAIYPITPSSTMAELCDAWMAQGQKNIFGTVPNVTELQSEAGAAGTIHGSLTAGALTTTFTASQGLLLMIPNMYKIAGELLPAVFHVTARALSAQALSIFGDHQDVMATRATGFALLASSTVQEVMDFAVVAHMATLKTRVPIVHFFDGFRSSHEIQKICEVEIDHLKKLVDHDLIRQFKNNALTPDRPTLRGTAQNPDIYFQARETVNVHYQSFGRILQDCFDEFAGVVGRQYHLFEYVGHPQADIVMTLMASANATVEETVNYLNRRGYKVGLIKCRLFRPFEVAAFNKVLPSSAKRILVLDRTKEPGCNGEPLYLEILHAVKDKKYLDVYGGRYGLSSKEFTPSMVKAVFDHFALDSKNKPIEGFTIGITDDVTHLSIPVTEKIDTENADVYRAKFYGLGSDGTVGANKNSIKILGELTDNFVQGYFVYDSKKAGAITISHLRTSKSPINSTYLIDRPDFVAIHQSSFLGHMNLLEGIKEGGMVLLNSRHTGQDAYDALPVDMKRTLIEKRLKLFVIDAHQLASAVGLRGRINMVMQAAFFKITKIVPEEKILKALENSVRKSYGSKGEKIVQMNLNALHEGWSGVTEVDYVLGDTVGEAVDPLSERLKDAPDFVKNIILPIMKQQGDDLPVSALPKDGIFELGGSAYEKRCIATQLPDWIGFGVGHNKVCIQCNLCALVCPHAAIRPGIIDDEDLKRSPQGYETMPINAADGKEFHYRIQLYPEDCTGCEACAEVCPGFEKDPQTKEKTGRVSLTMVPVHEIMERERSNLKYFQSIKSAPTAAMASDKSIKTSQYNTPLFQFSGACAGCGETPYIKLLTQLYGDRLYIANATGCSSIYGGTAPTIPYCKNEEGRGPAWQSSLFEDNAEFGYGMRIAVNQNRVGAIRIVEKMVQTSHKDLQAKAQAVLSYGDTTDTSKATEIRGAVQQLMDCVRANRAEVVRLTSEEEFQAFANLKDYLVPKSVWIVGGDGWAYDIGYGGVDHVLASSANVNLLVLDTQVYSNTGGQSSKSTPLVAVAKFAASGKGVSGKKLATQAISYNHVYVAQVCYGANPTQALKAFTEAESYDGPSIILAYSPCIEHGFNMAKTGDEMKKAVESGFWPLYRFDPRNLHTTKGPLKIDCKEPSLDLAEFLDGENRFRALKKGKPERYEELLKLARQDYAVQWKYLKVLEENFKMG